MKYYLAPLEGVTNYIYRNAYHNHFEKMDKYFTPFISTNSNARLSAKELDEILPDNNIGQYTVPQILGNNSDDFISTANVICEYGYNEINLNLGCPSNTVVAKNKGSGFLFHTAQLDRFLDEIYSQAKMKISIKTRLGKYDPEEFYEIVKIFNKYPLEELIIHPRIQKDMYRNTPNLAVFSTVLDEVKAPVCYNGDIFTPGEHQNIISKYPDVQNLMLGRGIIGNPALLGSIKKTTLANKAVFKSFHDTLFHNYLETMRTQQYALSKMKEIWFYMIHIFEDNTKFADQIRKSKDLSDYKAIVEALFESNSLQEDTEGYRCVVNNLKIG
ncbi:MAG: tRNA-dihydrouridine synthase family protein [Clostridiales bacterium]|nr:tRNA-dihydrouridine synthase family protein [Clostridiales bacterium]